MKLFPWDTMQRYHQTFLRPPGSFPSMSCKDSEATNGISDYRTAGHRVKICSSSTEQTAPCPVFNGRRAQGCGIYQIF